MLLSARVLSGVTSVNDYCSAEYLEWTQGDTIDLYLQLTDLTKDRSLAGFSPAGRRYVPQVGATLQVRLDNIDDAVAVTRQASQPYPTQDPSIWRVSVAATDVIRGTCALALTLTEGVVVTRGRVEAAARIHSSGTL